MESGNESGIPQPKPQDVQQIPELDQSTIQNRDDARQATKPYTEGVLQYYKDAAKENGILGSLKDAEIQMTPEQGQELRRHMVEIGFLPETRTETQLRISREDRERLASMTDLDAGNAIGKAIISRSLEKSGFKPLEGAIKIELEEVTVSNITNKRENTPALPPKQD